MKHFFLHFIKLKDRKYFKIIGLLISINISTQLYAQLKTGDPGVTFDTTKFDNRYPQMREWQKAGVRGGIPFLKDIRVVKIINKGANSAAINRAIVDASKQNGQVAVFLKNGAYDIDKTIIMKSNVSLIGESRAGVKCNIRMRGSDAFRFYKVSNSGIYTLTIQGSWGKPKYDWNYSLNANDELPGNDNVSVKFNDSRDCWLDKVNIYNCAKDPVRVPANHITLRDLKVDGAHKKAGGAQGYFFIQGAYNLITGCEITHLRHISLQGSKVEYNVVYDNDFRQEVSFHSGDKGNNLIENNRITLPKDMPNSKADTPNAVYNNRNEPNYYAIMGPWSTQHQNSKNPNFVYKNNCLEENHNNLRPWSNPNLLYKGPRQVKPRDPSTNFPALPVSQTPKGGTLYPIVLGEDTPVNKLPIVHFKTLSEGDVFEQNKSLKPVIMPSDTDGTINNVKLYLNEEFIRQESFAPYEWGHLSGKDNQLKNLKSGVYSLKAVATDDKGGVSEKTIVITIKDKEDTNDNYTPIGEIIWIQSKTNLRYVTTELRTNNIPLECDRKNIGKWEQFEVVDASNGLIALKAISNGKYITVNQSFNSPLFSNADSLGNLEKFKWVSLGNQEFAIKSNHNGKYIQAALNKKDAPLLAKGIQIRAWETFIFGIVNAKNQKEEVFNTNSFEIYPNPSLNFLTITGLSNLNKKNIHVYDLNGKLIKNITTNKTELEIDLTSLLSGVYFVKVFDDNENKSNVKSNKIIKL